jgi:Mrp family chromosome partitioning ATPase
MGRTLEALRQVETREATAESAPPADGPQLQVVSADGPDEEMPYIEVGGKGRAVEGSPDVLAASAARPASVRKPTLAPPGPLTVAFQPCREAAPVPRMAAEVIAYHEPEHEVSKQYRALLGQVLPEAADEAGRVLLFTALGPGAGVTTALLNLAVSACAAKRREAVIVDANLARPALAARVGLPPGPGLRDLVAGSAALDQAVRPTVQERLHVLTAGAASARGGVLSAEAVRWVVGWLRQRFELVFLDGPAWDGGAELAALVGAADRVLLVLDQADTDRPEVRAATRTIARLGGQLGGLLVTG